MAVKSIVDIEVNDGAFQKFAEAFKKYQAQLEKTPKVWDEASKSTKGTTITFEKLAAALLAQSVFAHDLNKENDKQSKAVERQASAWDRMSKSSATFGKNILSATRSLLRWGEITGVVSGLLGAGGLFGIERLASAASGMRRSSLGLGASIGGQEAFGVAYGRVIDPQAILSGVAQGMYDVRGRAALGSAGLTASQIAPGRDTADVAADLIPALKKLADRTPDALLGNVLTSRGLDQFIGLQDFIRLKHTSSSELGEYAQTFRRDKGAFALPPAEARAWQDFNVKLTEAGKRMQISLIDNLTPLAPALTRLSGSFTDLFVKVLKVAKDDGLFDQLAGGIDWLSSKIGTPEFKQGVVDFTNGVIELGNHVVSVVKWINDHWPGGGSSTSTDAPTVMPYEPIVPRVGDPYYERLYRSRHGSGSGAPVRGASWTTGGGAGAGGDFGSLEDRYGLPSGMLNTIEGIESGHGRAMRSSAGAEGWFQFMPGTWKQYGRGGDPYNRSDAARAAARYFQKLLKEFGGNVAQAVAGYNAGEGRVEGAIRQFGSNWLSGVPHETQDYVRKFFANSDSGLRSRATQRVQIDINNYAGANHSISASQMVGPAFPT